MKTSIEILIEHLKDLEQQKFIPENVKSGINLSIEMAQMIVPNYESERKIFAFSFLMFFFNNNTEQKSMEEIYQSFIQSLKNENHETDSE